jgi:zinc protease
MGTSSARALLLGWALIAACGDGGGAAPEETPPPAPPLVFPDEPFRATQPAPGAARAFDPPVPELFTFGNGVEVALVERHTIPVVSWYIQFPNGSIADPTGKEGLASLCLNVMFQGSARLERSLREQALADSGATVGLSAGSHDVTFSGECLKGDVAATVELWGDLFQLPGLSQDDFDGTVRARVRSAMIPSSLTPDAVAVRVSSRLYWGPGHPYVREPTAASFMAIRLQDCQAFVTSTIKAPGARLWIAGAISKAEVLERFARLETLRVDMPSPALQAPPAAAAPGALYFVDAPGAPQSIIDLRSPGPVLGSPQAYAAELLAGILAGSGITSRIGMNVREMKGYAYAASGGFGYSKGASSFSFFAPVRADASAPSLFEILEEIRKIRETEVTEQEVARELANLIGGLPYLFETAAQVRWEHSWLAYHGMPATYYRDFAGAYQGVTRAAIRQAALDYLAPERLQIVVVGDGSTVLPELRKLAAMRPELMNGEVIRLDSEGRRL